MVERDHDEAVRLPYSWVMRLSCSPGSQLVTGSSTTARSGVPRLLAAGLMLVSAAIVAGCSSGASPKAQPVARAGAGPVLVVQAPEAGAWVRLLRAGGIPAVSEPIGYLPKNSAAVVPDGAVLTKYDIAEVVSWVKAGGRLVTAAPGLLDLLGATFGPSTPVSGASVNGLSTPVSWARPVDVNPVQVKQGGVTVLSSALHTGAHLAVHWAYGRGQILGFGVDPMGSGRIGYELFPTLARMVAGVTDPPPGPTRDGLELYLDPGLLPPSISHNVNAVAAMVDGARIVDVAAWYFNYNNPADNYPYQALIAALHARGILAYAWLEPPFVNQAMWQKDPQCREKTATGADAHVYWRYLISLETPSCFHLAWQQWDQVLGNNPWDGVNVAELYFQPPTDPSTFTPFSAGALALFGRNPKTNMAAFMQFRTQLVTELNRQMLAQLNGLPAARNLAFELTVIDSLLDPAEAAGVGSDVSALAAVARQGGASLEVEDPFTTWTDGPLRYARITAELRSLTSPGMGLIDLNVVDRPGARPTSKMTGGELDLAASTAAAYSGRLGVYALGTIGPADLGTLAAAMAGSVQTTSTGVVAPWTVTVHAPPGVADSRVRIDGVQWPTASGVVVVPGGQHSVQWSGGAPAGPGLTRFTGELSTASTGPAAMDLAYYSEAAVYAVVTARPASLTLDGAPANLTVTADPAGGWSVRLPAGTHRAVLGF